MKQIILVLLAGAALIAAALPTRADPRSFSVLTYHGDAVRSGHFIVPGLTQERARSIHLDTAFRAELSGRVYASRFIGKRRDRTPRSLSL